KVFLFIYIYIIYFKQFIYLAIKKAFLKCRQSSFFFYIYKSIGSGTGIVLKVSVMYRYRIKTKRYPSLSISDLNLMRAATGSQWSSMSSGVTCDLWRCGGWLGGGLR